jgi:hypothetical protein
MIERGDLESDPGTSCSLSHLFPSSLFARIYRLDVFRVELIFSGPFSTSTLRPNSPLFRSSPPLLDRETRMERWIRRSSMGRSSREVINLVRAPIPRHKEETDSRHTTFCINSLAHWTGLQPYTEEVSAKGNYVSCSMN